MGARAQSNAKRPDPDSDVCDNCPGQGWWLTPEPADANPPCHNDSECQAHGEGLESVCVPQHYVPGNYGMPPHESTPRCTKHPDGDHDGVGDACDNCVDVPNSFDGPGHQANCNIYSEMALNDVYPYTGDACDPYPCADFDLAATTPDCGNLDPDADEWNEQWGRVRVLPGLLPRTQAHGAVR